jgi:hypothetical protein
MMKKLGTLERVEVRSFWSSEASAFTPWLASEENLSLLGKAVGLELELEHTELAVGPFAADIVARDATGNYVVIENQLGKTDHDHLGKALTYAAALGAKHIIWVAADFTDEHRKALDWLNDNSTEDLGYYGVQVELWSIDGSAPAVRFNVQSRPTQSVRQLISTASGELSEAKRLQLEWWTVFRDALLAQRAVPSVQSPRPQYWYNIALGRRGIHLSAFANTFDRRIGVRVYMMGRYGAAAALQQLLEAKDAIEKEIGSPLVWDPNPEATDKVIALSREADLTRKDKWPEYLKWLVDITVGFRRVFGPRVKALDLAETPGEEDADALTHA